MKLIWIGHGGSQGRGGENPEARDAGKPTTGFTLGVPCQELPIKYIVHTDINPTQVVPKGPDLANWLTPHGREAMGGRPFGDGTPPGPTKAGEEVPAAHSAG